LVGASYDHYLLRNPFLDPTDTIAPTITISEEAVLSYTVGDPWSDSNSLSWCSASDNIDGDILCDILNTELPYVDTSTVGTYTITYYAADSSGNETTYQITITVSEAYSSSVDLAIFYQSTTSLTGESLFLELRSIVQTGMIKISYGDARYILDETDEDPLVPGNVLTIYDRQSVSGVWTGTNSSTTYNREHVWPNSRLGVPRVENTDKNIASDLHNLRAAIPATNSSRGNKWFDYTTTTASYYPGNDDRGDVARILLYMVVMYPQLNIVNLITSLMDDATYQEDGMYMAKMSVLLDWHNLDPVDDFERNRNDVIYHYQNNRNPFIDDPNFVQLIWGNNPSVVTSSTQFIN